MENRIESAEKICAKIGFDIPRPVIKEQENVIRNALGVLTEDGIFAYIIWLESKSGKKEEGEVTKKIIESSSELLKEIGFFTEKVAIDKVREKILEDGSFVESIPQLFLAKQLLEKMLIYALYRAKAIAAEGS